MNNEKNLDIYIIDTILNSLNYETKPCCFIDNVKKYIQIENNQTYEEYIDNYGYKKTLKEIIDTLEDFYNIKDESFSQKILDLINNPKEMFNYVFYIKVDKFLYQNNNIFTILENETNIYLTEENIEVIRSYLNNLKSALLLNQEHNNLDDFLKIINEKNKIDLIDR